MFIILAVTAVCVALCVALNFAYGALVKRLVQGGLKRDYFPSGKKFLCSSIAIFFIVGFFFAGLAYIDVQNACIGLTAEEAFDIYARQANLDTEAYRAVDGGNVTFFVGETTGEEEWYAYEKSGLFYVRSYGLATYHNYYGVEEDGSLRGLVASVAEVETDNGYYYFIGLYDDSILNRISGTSVIFNGNETPLQCGTFIVSEEKMKSFALENVKISDML